MAIYKDQYEIFWKDTLALGVLPHLPLDLPVCLTGREFLFLDSNSSSPLIRTLFLGTGLDVFT